MSNENPSNTPGWRNKLDDLEHLPGSGFNGNAAWDKLHGRLRGNKKSKKIYWYWIAAACLLFGVMITILNYQKPTPQNPGKETVKEQPRESKPVLKVDETNKNENENVAKSEKNKIVSASDKPGQRDRRVAHTQAVAKVHSDDVVINYPEKEPLVKPLQITNANPTTAVLPPKKKLNVVHINELGDPVIEIPDMASKMGKHSFRLGNGEVYANPSTVYKNTDFTILKTKL